MTARKALELTAIFLLPGAFLYAASAFVSLELDFREWSAGGRLMLVMLWVALVLPMIGYLEEEKP